MDTIALRQANGVWVATHSGPRAAVVQELFGTTELPTAYGASVPGAVVQQRLTALNPGVSVVIDSEEYRDDLYPYAHDD